MLLWYKNAIALPSEDSYRFRSHHPETNVTVLIEQLLVHDVITLIFSGQTLYNLGYLTEQIVENLLNEQQLGLSESIIVHLKQFDELSSKLLGAVENRELDLLIRCIKKINRQTQTVKAQALISAMPQMGEATDGKRIVLKGEIPSPINPPSGCRFRKRCNYAKGVCKDEEPGLTDLGGGHLFTISI